MAYYLESLRPAASIRCCSDARTIRCCGRLFERVLGPGVRIVDSATATAAAVHERLTRWGIARRDGRAGSQSFFVTETPDRFVRVGRRFFGPEVESAVRIER